LDFLPHSFADSRSIQGNLDHQNLTMLATTLAIVSFLAASAYCDVPGFSTADRTFGAMMKRQNGYYPTTHHCGSGDTCAEACGVGQETCPSSSGLYCYDPTAGDICCPDLSGNSCDAGYYCTSDPDGTTYCCPEGQSLSDCGAAYSLTVALVSQTGTVSPPSPTGNGTASTTPAPFSSSGLIHVSYPTPPSSRTAVLTPSSNITFSATASAPIQVTTNAAERMAYRGMGVGVAIGFVGAIVGL